jgi:hypothetical protein
MVEIIVEVIKMRKPIYGLYINLDERGDFNADVRDVNDKTIFEMDAESANELVEGGFLKNPRDSDEVESYLRESGVIPKNGFVYGMARFEMHQERLLKNKNDASMSP